MIIILIGDEKKSRWSVQFDEKLITLNCCDYLILLSLAIVWTNNKEDSLHKSYLFDDLTSAYIYRMKYNIHRLADINTDNIIKHTHHGNYRLNVDDIVIENQAYKFDDNRFKIVLDKYGKSKGV